MVLTSWDKYRKEVLSGSLDWSPMHTSEAFWRQNADKFEEKDFQLLRVLLKLLESSRETRTLAVACSDVGRWVQAERATLEGGTVYGCQKGRTCASKFQQVAEACHRPWHQ